MESTTNEAIQQAAEQIKAGVLIDDEYIRQKHGMNVEVANDKAIPPFMEIPASEGFGYYGVLLEDTVDETVQCHICGKWLRQITNSHVKKHFVDGDSDVSDTVQYREKYGFRTNAFLSSYSLRESRRQRMIDQGKKNEHFRREFVERHNKQWKGTTGHAYKGYGGTTAEGKNAKGTCEAQLLQRLKDFYDEHGRVPNFTEVPYAQLAARRFGSWNNFVECLDLTPNRFRYTDDELLESVEGFITKFGRRPTKRDFADGALPSPSTFKAHFGSWQKAFDMVEESLK